MNNDLTEEHPWDASLAETLPGLMVLFGLDYFEADGEEPIEQQQSFGRVISADEVNGLASGSICLPIPVRSEKRGLANIGFDQQARWSSIRTSRRPSRYASRRKCDDWSRRQQTAGLLRISLIDMNELQTAVYASIKSALFGRFFFWIQRRMSFALL